MECVEKSPEEKKVVKKKKKWLKNEEIYFINLHHRLLLSLRAYLQPISILLAFFHLSFIFTKFFVFSGMAIFSSIWFIYHAPLSPLLIIQFYIAFLVVITFYQFALISHFRSPFHISLLTPSFLIWALEVKLVSFRLFLR